MSEYISISEFARRAGVSRQTIYNRLDGDLSNFCKTVKGQKVINDKALTLFSVKESNDLTAWEIMQKQIDMMERTNQKLLTELDVKNRQIDMLNHQMNELSDRLRESHILIDQQQKLHAIAEAKQPEPIEADPEPAEPDPDELTAEEPKKKWWQRFF